jgi:hypothetical protein
MQHMNAASSAPGNLQQACGRLHGRLDISPIGMFAGMPAIADQGQSLTQARLILGMDSDATSAAPQDMFQRLVIGDQQAAGR